MKYRIRYFLTVLLLLSGILLFSGCMDEDGFEEEESSTSTAEQASGVDEVQITPIRPVHNEHILFDTGDEYLFGEEDISFLDIDDLPGWFDRAAARGVNVISFSPFTPEGVTLIDSQALKKAGFKPEPDAGYIFPAILREAEKHNMRVIVMLEGIAHIKDNFMPYSDEIKPEMLTPEAVQQLISEIAAEGRKQGVGLTKKIKFFIATKLMDLLV